ncbi:hypothetical protein P280DRAFT_469835 [Massarina eburnea CBS 473.64]|uniref:Uncharacterized protein n=1 Tax=Massarina eburnea CBS 473.64 TaxID=1395130 RepID=A0A6A6S123_9PLEO|nr:hypothetical protein P280DRAFT_469835 [Massarina eburnea CBS 473.64]
MNYSNMIEEKNLKKTFIIATLCSTLVGTFSSSIGLWDRVQDKRKQTKRDKTQDTEIKQLRSRVEEAEKRGPERSGRRKENQRRIRSGHDDDNDDEDVGDNFERSSALIQRQFDEGVGRLGSRFAQGDTLTENQLQRQIIALQQTVIQVLQDALANDRHLTRGDMARLVAASNEAREGSIDALREQQRRLADAEADAVHLPPLRQLTLDDSRSNSPRSSSPRLALVPALAPIPPKGASTVIEATSLFCPYSRDLQHMSKKPLSASFAPGGSSRCPDCMSLLDVTSEDFWQIGKRTPMIVREGAYEKEIMETREFHLGQRFVIKCHTEEGEYACVLCSKHRERDAICRTVESLVNHVGKFHDMAELEREVDLRETLPLGSRGGSVVGSAVSAREIEVRGYH